MSEQADRMEEAKWRQILADIDQKRADAELKRTQEPLENQKFQLENKKFEADLLRMWIQAAGVAVGLMAASATIGAVVARLIP